MVPVAADAEEALDIFSKAHWSSYVEDIAWTKGRVAIIDNWRVLHGRGGAQTLDQDRILLRILIE
jgi:alpha-ketoglutarate-dependent taurine dioxygenase